MTQMRKATTTSMQLPLLRTLGLPLLLIGSIISFVANVKGENIVFFHPTGSYSHRVSLWPLVKRLVNDGHHITFISSYPPKDPLPNVTELIPEQMAKYINDYMQGGDLDITKRISGQLEPCYNHGPRMGLFSCEKFLEDPAVKTWLKTEPKVDLVILDWFMSECILGLAYKNNAPFILYASTVMVGTFYETFGFVPDTAGIPDFEHHYTPPMTFWERADNALQPLIWKYKMIAYFDELGKLVREKYNIPDMPPMEDIVRNASLMMWSESIIEGYPHTLPPNWINVGGMHCEENPKPLPKDLEEIAQKGKDGFIYFSFGSAVVPGNLPETYLRAFFGAISEFPNIQFLWKWTGEMPKIPVPKNLYIGKWFPQQSLLAHKKILAFVTQAGRPSTQEAIFHGVPIIALPVYEDQDYTAERVRDMGGGIALEIATITKEQFANAIRDITSNSKYKARMQKLSELFRDRPMKPADTAYYWTDYVLRHKDMSHFRTVSHDLTWYERRHLDVWVIIFSAALLLSMVSLYVIVQLLRLILKASVHWPNNQEHKIKKMKTGKKKKN